MSDKLEVLEIYEVGSPVMIDGSNCKGLVEKVIIGENRSITYQLICYTPERHQVVANGFEVSSIIDKEKKMPVGFSQGIQSPSVTVKVDADGKYQGAEASDGVNVIVSKHEGQRDETQTKT